MPHCNIWHCSPPRMWGCWRSLPSCRHDSAAQQVSLRSSSTRRLIWCCFSLLWLQFYLPPPGRQHVSGVMEVAPPQVKAEHKVALPQDIDRFPFSRYAKSLLKVRKVKIHTATKRRTLGAQAPVIFINNILNFIKFVSLWKSVFNTGTSVCCLQISNLILLHRLSGWDVSHSTVLKLILWNFQRCLSKHFYDKRSKC